MSRRALGKVWAIAGKEWACNTGQWWYVTDSTGQSKAPANIGFSAKILGAGDGNRTRVLSLGS